MSDLVDLLRHYSNRSDLLEQLHKVSETVSQHSVSAPTGASETGRTDGSTRSRGLRHRFTAEEQQAMIDLYHFGAPACVVAERYGIGVRAIKRLLQTHGVHRTAENGSRRLCDRFSAEELEAMVGLYRSGVSAREVAEEYNVNLRSFKRLLQANGARRRNPERVSKTVTAVQ